MGKVFMGRAVGVQGIPMSSVINGGLFARAYETAQRRVAERWQITDLVVSPLEEAGIQEASENVLCITLYNEAAFIK